VTRWLGVDGCRGGWLAAWIDDDGNCGCEIIADIAAVDRLGAAMVMIDIPIGLPQSGRRVCDLAARALLGTARSRVFLDARRPLLDFADHGAANQWAKRDGKGVSAQLFNILPKIAAVDRFITPSRQATIRESHPELVFMRLGGADPLPTKKTAPGRKLRRDLVHAGGFAAIDDWLTSLARKAAQPDDLLDACALAIVARAPHGRVSDVIEHDARGLRMEIWY
jgi:predicted RNase H-like nuclease